MNKNRTLNSLIKSRIKNQLFLKRKEHRRMLWLEAKVKVVLNHQCQIQDLITKDMQATTHIRQRQVPIKKLNSDLGLQ